MSKLKKEDPAFVKRYFQQRKQGRIFPIPVNEEVNRVVVDFLRKVDDAHEKASKSTLQFD